MRLKIGKKLKTATLNFRFTGSEKNSVHRLVHFWKILKLIVNVCIKYTHQQPKERFTSFQKLWYAKNCSFLLHWSKNIIKLCR